MPLTISKRVIHTFMGGIVLVSFFHGNESYDYTYDLGRGLMTDAQAIAQMERSGFMEKARACFLAEVYLGEGLPS